MALPPKTSSKYQGLYSLKRRPEKKRSSLDFLSRKPPPNVTPSPKKLPLEDRDKTPITNLTDRSPARQKLMDYWKKPVMGKMLLDQFVSITGSLAHAIAPDTPQGRVGAALSQMAQPIYAKRMEQEMEAPERELDRRLKEARIKDLEREEAPEQWDAYYKRWKDKKPIGDIIKDFKELTAKKSEPQKLSDEQRYIADTMKDINPKTGKLFTRNEALAKRTELTAKPPKPKTFHVVDDAGNVSVYEDGELKRGTGKGKTKTKRAEKEVDLIKVLDYLDYAQENEDENTLLVVEKMLENTDFEVVKREGEKKSLFGVDWLRKDIPSEYILQRKDTGEEVISEKMLSKGKGSKAKKEDAPITYDYTRGQGFIER